MNQSFGRIYGSMQEPSHYMERQWIIVNSNENTGRSSAQNINHCKRVETAHDTIDGVPCVLVSLAMESIEEANGNGNSRTLCFLTRIKSIGGFGIFWTEISAAARSRVIPHARKPT